MGDLSASLKRVVIGLKAMYLVRRGTRHRTVEGRSYLENTCLLAPSGFEAPEPILARVEAMIAPSSGLVMLQNVVQSLFDRSIAFRHTFPADVDN